MLKSGINSNVIVISYLMNKDFRLEIWFISRVGLLSWNQYSSGERPVDLIEGPVDDPVWGIHGSRSTGGVLTSC